MTIIISTLLLLHARDADEPDLRKFVKDRPTYTVQQLGSIERCLGISCKVLVNLPIGKTNMGTIPLYVSGKKAFCWDAQRELGDTSQIESRD
jgi:hypothetical protein